MISDKKETSTVDIGGVRMEEVQMDEPMDVSVIMKPAPAPVIIQEGVKVGLVKAVTEPAELVLTNIFKINRLPMSIMTIS